MTHPSRAKGDRFERWCVNQLRDVFGIQEAERVPLSGAAGGSHTDDLTMPVCGKVERIECKCRKRAWSDLFGFLNPPHHAQKPYALFIKADRTDTLVVLPLATFVALSKGIL